MSLHKHTIAIVDDHPIVVEGLTKLLTARGSYEIAGCFTNGYEFMQFFQSNPVDVVLLDIILPGKNGMDLCGEIKSLAPATVVLALSNHEERSAIMKMLELGANGYILKNAGIDELAACIQDALDGQIAFSSTVKQIISKPKLQGKDTRVNVRLTVREIEILKLIGSGTTTARIAEKLFLSKFTVENHRKNMLQKFGARNVAEMITMATKQGFL